MGFLDKLKGMFGRSKDKATEVAGDVAEKAAEVASDVAEKAGEVAAKAGAVAAKGVDAAATGVDKVTGGKFHDKIEDVSGKVESALDKDDKGGKGSSSKG